MSLRMCCRGLLKSVLCNTARLAPAGWNGDGATKHHGPLNCKDHCENIPYCRQDEALGLGKPFADREAHEVGAGWDPQLLHQTVLVSVDGFYTPQSCAAICPLEEPLPINRRISVSRMVSDAESVMGAPRGSSVVSFWRCPPLVPSDEPGAPPGTVR